METKEAKTMEQVAMAQLVKRQRRERVITMADTVGNDKFKGDEVPERGENSKGRIKLT